MVQFVVSDLSQDLRLLGSATLIRLLHGDFGLRGSD